MNADTSTPEANNQPAEFEPSPVLLHTQARARRLVRNAARASMFKPRLRSRAARAVLSARFLERAERKQWEEKS